MVDLKLPAGLPGLLGPLRPVLAGVLLLAAAWMGWRGWEVYADSRAREEVAAVRDTAVAAVARVLKTETQRLKEAIARPAVTTAVARGDFTGAASELAGQWKGAGEVAVVPTDLSAVYAALPAGGYGRLAAMEAAVVEGGPVAWVVRDGRAPQLALAAPIRQGDALAAIAVGQVPVARLTAPLDNAMLEDGAYLALRQQAFTVHERGDASLAGGAETLAAKIPGTEMRIAAAVPDVAGGPFGLGGVPLLAIAALLALAGAALLAAPRLRRASTQGDAVDDDLTLADAVAMPATPVRGGDGTTATAGAGEPPPLPGLPGAPNGAGVDPSIFRAYDIRGVVGRDLDARVAELIGQAIGTVMHEQGHADVVVGRDGRLSGPTMTEALIAGLRRAGRNVIDIGLAPTPVTYFGAYHLRAGSCVSVTGSHNPPDYNGFKIVVGSETLSGPAITDLHARIASGRLHTSDTPGELSTQDIGEDYVQRIAGDVQIDRPLKVVVDAGNGVAGELGPRVLRAIGAEVTPLYCDIDGTFPNHHPDPSEPHNLADLVQMVQRLDADLGIAFDGDGDRLGVVTRDGTNVFPDRLLMLFAADVLERNPGAMVIFDVKCTGRLPGWILRHGGSPLMWKTGHSLVKAKMRETDAELAGEMSGHFFFSERWYGFDDGIYAAARLLEILAAAPGTPTETLDALPDGLSTPEIKVEAPGGDPHAFVERFREQARFEGARASTIDGLRVDWPDGWGLVRASNTTPVLVMRFDADSPEAMARIQGAFREQLRAVQPDLALPF